MPPGGPVDKIPPTIISIIPPSGTINLNTRKIIIKFSEYMDEKSFKNGIGVFPRLDNPIDIRFRGKEVTLVLPNSLESDDTYIISLNRNIKDEHGIPIAKTIQTAYSSGDKISRGIISGIAFGTGEKSIHLWKINTVGLDSLFATQPDYITDVNDDGIFSFNYLAKGIYRLLGVSKSSAGLPLNTLRTEYALHWDNTLNLDENDTLSNINLRFWKEPEELKLESGEWSAFNWGKLLFNNDLPDSIIADLHLTLDDSIKIDSSLYYIDPMDQKNLILLVNDSFNQNSLKVNIESIKMNNERLLDSAEVVIQIPQEPDTSYLKILKPKQNFEVGISNLVKNKLDIVWSKPINISSDSLLTPNLFKNDTILIESEIKKINPFYFQLAPTELWDENEKYKLKIFRDGIVTNNGRWLKDSISTYKIYTTNRIGHGTVVGIISNSRDSNLAAELISTKNPSLSQTTLVNSESEFEFKTVPEGKYSLYFFNDSNNDTKYSFGNASMKIPSEWFYFYPDTFDVRANWETELPPINFPEVK